MPRVKSISREDNYFPRGHKSEGVGARVGGRLKKAKIVFDPSINNMSRKITRSLSVNSETFPSSIPKNNKSDNSLKKTIKTRDSPPVLEIQATDCCMICGKVDARKTRKLISCKDCNYRVHSSCLKITYLNHALLEEHWRCDNCCTCVVCYETCEVGPLVSCCVCIDAYHLSCHNPKIHPNKNLNKCKWECTKCQNINKHVLANKTSSIDDRKRSSPTSSEIGIASKIPKELQDKKSEKTVCDITKLGTKLQTTIKDDHIPDISDWSCERVSKYMEKYFPNEAHIFREHEIDGASLLLMKRSDIISSLALKLGPAIRIYSFIVQLQSQSNDPRLTWM